jgi:Spy/CpxP family protein refolding chaperone
MDTASKKRLLIGTIIILIVINISALSTIAYNKYSQKRNIEQRDYNRQDRKEKNIKGSKNYHSRVKYFVKKELELSDKQFEQYSNLKDANMEKTHQIMQEIGKKKKLIFKEFCKENQDTLALIQLTEDIGKLHVKMQKETLRHFNAIEEMLSPEQIIKFKKMLCNMAERRGKGYNQQYGKNNKKCR